MKKEVREMATGLKYCKLKGKSHESAQEWMGRLYKAADCEYHEYDQKLTAQIIHRIDIDVMTGKILWELLALKDVNEATSEQILLQAQRMEE